MFGRRQVRSILYSPCTLLSALAQYMCTHSFGQSTVRSRATLLAWALTLQWFAVMVHLSEQKISPPKLSQPKHIPACRSVFELTRYFLGCNFLHTLTGIFTIDSNKNQHLFRPCLHTKWGISGLSIFFVKNLNAEETLCTKFSICVLSTSPLKLTY